MSLDFCDNIYKNKRVFVTGHTGFKGSWLTMWLLELGAEVIGYALPSSHERSHFRVLKLQDHVNHIEGDIRDLAHLSTAMKEAEPEFVFHLAAQALVRDSYVDPKRTFDTNVGGSVNILESVRQCGTVGVLVYITSDKCYKNLNWEWGYRETDVLGGKDPYSASKACAEIVLSSYRESFFSDLNKPRVASARAGNVIGGGDWAKDRLVPDCIKSLLKREPIVIRNPDATRPWQHVLEPLGGYLLLGSKLYRDDTGAYCSTWNFGPDKTSNRTVKELALDLTQLWGEGEVIIQKPHDAYHEDTLLQLNCDKAYNKLKWAPKWHYHDCLLNTISWYKDFVEGACVWDLTRSQIHKYTQRWKELEGD